MPALIGKYEYSLDPKNRMFLPPRYREHLQKEGEGCVILSLGLDGCLYLFLPSQWERLLSQSQELFQFKDKVKQRAVKRHLFSSAHETPVDDQGRILVPPALKKHAGLKREVVVVGTGSKAELWDKARLAGKEKMGQRAFEQHSADLDLL